MKMTFTPNEPAQTRDHNMTETADERQEGLMPGTESIPADMPDAPPADMPLEYNLQNFNALVAANTAMTTQLARADEYQARQDGTISAMARSVDDLRDSARAMDKIVTDLRREVASAKSDAQDLRGELDFARSERDALQRRLDRSLGYLDRVIDEDDDRAMGDDPVVSRPAPRPPVGPSLDDMPMPRRRSSHDGDFGAVIGAGYRPAEAGRPRRYR